MDAQALQQRTFAIDLHNDTIVAHMRRRNASLVRQDVHYDTARNGIVTGPYGLQFPPTDPLQIDLPRMYAAGIDAGFYAIDVTLAHNAHLAYAVDALGYVQHDLALQAPGTVIVREAGDLDRASGAHVPAIVLHIEHADVTEGSLNVLQALHSLGVRSLGLTHNASSCAADGCWEAREGVGLTSFGVRLVQEMNRLGMVVDLAHVSPGAFYHGLEVSTRPVLFSHGNARALCDHPRNLSDDQLRALAQQGGVIGVSFVPAFVAADNPSLERLLDHFNHIVEVAGIDCVGIGSDFDGGGTLVEDVSAVERVVAGLGARGYDDESLAKILGGNGRRVLEACLRGA